jgi:hypothetical protein
MIVISRHQVHIWMHMMMTDHWRSKVAAQPSVILLILGLVVANTSLRVARGRAHLTTPIQLENSSLISIIYWSTVSKVKSTI